MYITYSKYLCLIKQFYSLVSSIASSPFMYITEYIIYTSTKPYDAKTLIIYIPTMSLQEKNTQDTTYHITYEKCVSFDFHITSTEFYSRVTVFIFIYTALTHMYLPHSSKSTLTFLDSSLLSTTTSHSLYTIKTPPRPRFLPSSIDSFNCTMKSSLLLLRV